LKININKSLDKGLKVYYIADKIKQRGDETMNKTKELKLFLEDLYVNRFHLSKPRITMVKDGVYIHTGENFKETHREMKLFVSIYDFEQSRELTVQYLENCDDRIIHILEEMIKERGSEKR